MQWEIEFIQCLIRHVDEGLGVIPMERANRITFILTREHGLDQGDEFMGIKRTLGQTYTSYDIEIEVEGGH